jgi:hypothetical protein
MDHHRLYGLPTERKHVKNLGCRRAGGVLKVCCSTTLTRIVSEG